MKADKKQKSSKASQWIQGLQAEFKKIIWPDKKTTGKQTVAVITLSICIGLIVGLLDMVIKYLVGFIV